MARPKKAKVDESAPEAEVSKPIEKKTPSVEQFDPSIPENKQRHLRT